MHVVEIKNIHKSFATIKAVDDVSFTVEEGEIFGLLGPNGAGKTTTIRILLDIFKADQGSVSVLGGPMNDARKDQIGYMPEERGLYQDVPLERCLLYMATLKGLSTTEAHKRLDGYLEQFDLAEHRQKKIKELSKGMQQKAQIINTIVHDPQLIVIDEPFTSLDPVNTQMVKDLMEDLRSRGKTIIMSTHQMHQVEELCDRILIINHGREVLYGELEQIRHRFSGRDVLVKVLGELPELKGVEKVVPHNREIKLTLSKQATPQLILDELVAHKVPLEKFEIAIPELDEIFIRVVTREGENV